MKKFSEIFLMLSVMLLLAASANAAPVGTVTPTEKKVGYGLKITGEADLISGRDLDVANESIELEAKFYEAKISYTIMDGVDIYALLGSMSDGQVTEKVGANTYKYFFDTDFAWGLGASAVIHKFDNGVIVTTDGKYRSAEVGMTDIDINGTKYGLSSISNITGTFEEWQIALGIAKEFGEKVKFIPYAGVKYSDVNVKAQGTILGTTYNTGDTSSKDIIGGYVGTEVAFTDNISIYAEGRFIDETAISFGAAYKF